MASSAFHIDIFFTKTTIKFKGTGYEINFNILTKRIVVSLIRTSTGC